MRTIHAEAEHMPAVLQAIARAGPGDVTFLDNAKFAGYNRRGSKDSQLR